MNYIAVDTAGATVRLTTRRASGQIRIPLTSGQTAWGPAWPFLVMVTLNRGRRFRSAPSGLRKAACVTSPDPWLVALGAVMWEGIVQGLTWDAVKASVAGVLSSLQASGLAPLRRDQRTSRRSSFRLTFRLQEYAVDETLRRDMFLDIQRHHETLPPSERERLTSATRSAPPPPPPVRRKKA